MLNLSRLILAVNLIERTNLKESDVEEGNYLFQHKYLTINDTLVHNCSSLPSKVLLSFSNIYFI